MIKITHIELNNNYYKQKNIYIYKKLAFVWVEMAEAIVVR